MESLYYGWAARTKKLHWTLEGPAKSGCSDYDQLTVNDRYEKKYKKFVSVEVSIFPLVKKVVIVTESNSVSLFQKAANHWLIALFFLFCEFNNYRFVVLRAIVVITLLEVVSSSSYYDCSSYGKFSLLLALFKSGDEVKENKKPSGTHVWV